MRSVIQNTRRPSPNERGRLRQNFDRSSRTDLHEGALHRGTLEIAARDHVDFAHEDLLQKKCQERVERLS